ncbi:unnamed protein product [Boreogadus saida]
MVIEKGLERNWSDTLQNKIMRTDSTSVNEKETCKKEVDIANFSNVCCYTAPSIPDQPIASEKYPHTLALPTGPLVASLPLSRRLSYLTMAPLPDPSPPYWASLTFNRASIPGLIPGPAGPALIWWTPLSSCPISSATLRTERLAVSWENRAGVNCARSGQPADGLLPSLSPRPCVHSVPTTLQNAKS